MSAVHKFKQFFGMAPFDDRLEEDGYLDDQREAAADWRGRRSSYAADREYAEERDYGARPGLYTSGRGAGYDRGVEPARRLPASRGALAVAAQPEPFDEPVDEPAAAARIVTIKPSDYAEARVIGEQFRDGVAVIIDLVEMSNADAKRLVDFAAGLAFALRGSFDKVATKVFMLSPAGVDVEERRRIAESGFRHQR